jgi:hypothetical protein
LIDDLTVQLLFWSLTVANTVGGKKTVTKCPY